MRTLKKLSVISFVCLLVVAGIIIGMAQLEIATSSSDSYQEGMFTRGWIPSWIPKSATNIQEAHDIDTNEVWLTFRYSPSEHFYQSVCRLSEKEAIVFPPDKPWIFLPKLVRDIQNKTKIKPSLRFFECGTSPSRFLAINSQNHTAYVWSLGH